MFLLARICSLFLKIFLVALKLLLLVLLNSTEYAYSCTLFSCTLVHCTLYLGNHLAAVAGGHRFRVRQAGLTNGMQSWAHKRQFLRQSDTVSGPKQGCLSHNSILTPIGKYYFVLSRCRSVKKL